MSFGPENMQGEFELNDENRDTHIVDLVGIAPDARTKIPVHETRALILGARAGDTASQERLIATRLRWIYSHAFGDEIRSRADMELEDVMQMGVAATLEAARTVDAAHPEVHTLLHTAIPRIMDGWITEGKLVTSVDETGHTARQPARDRSVLRDKIVLTDQTVLDRMIEGTSEGREDDVAAPEAAVLRGGIEWLFDYAFVSPKQREVLRLRYGDLETPLPEAERDLPHKRNEVMSGTTLTLREIARRLGTSTQNISTLERDGLQALRRMVGLYPEAQGVEPTAEQSALREQWFADIAAKQERGEIAFVKGSLLQEPLPDAVQAYLDKSRRAVPDRRYSEMLQRALRKAGVTPGAATGQK